MSFKKEKEIGWDILFDLCLKYKQWQLLEEYWPLIDEAMECDE